MLETIREESEQPTGVVIFKDPGMIKECDAIGKGNSIWESPIGRAK